MEKVGLYIRIDRDAKTALGLKAERLGVSLTAYIRMILYQDIKNPKRQ